MNKIFYFSCANFLLFSLIFSLRTLFLELTVEALLMLWLECVCDMLCRLSWKFSTFTLKRPRRSLFPSLQTSLSTFILCSFFLFRQNLPSHCKSWSKVRETLRYYLADVISLNQILLEPSVVCACLRHTILLLPYFMSFPKICKTLMKVRESDLCAVQARASEAWAWDIKVHTFFLLTFHVIQLPLYIWSQRDSCNTCNSLAYLYWCYSVKSCNKSFFSSCTNVYIFCNLFDIKLFWVFSISVPYQKLEQCRRWKCACPVFFLYHQNYQVGEEEVFGICA